MSILKKYASFRLEVGTRVRSVAVGRREAFDGVIADYMHFDYLVADENGDGWHRERKELTVIGEAA